MKKALTLAALVAAAQIFIATPAIASTEIETAKESSTVVKVTPEEFSTRIVEDSRIPKGVEVVVKEGTLGERTFYEATDTLRGSDGEFKSVPILYEKVTKLPSEKVIRRGANTAVIDGISEKTKQLEKDKADKIAREAKEAADEAARAKVAKEIAERKTAISSPAPSANGITSPEENKAYARSILSESDFQCIDILAGRESGWNTTATNPSSGAYGVAQSLPGNKMAAAGADWQTNGKTQVNWMISYTIERYGSPCGAKAASDIKGWY